MERYMDFESLSKLASLLSRSFARDLFRLLVMYQTISASEAASRLNLHIRTAQDFLEGLEALGIVSKEEVMERKRPYFRYTLIRKKLRIEYDLNGLVDKERRETDLDDIFIRERKNSGSIFKTSPKTGMLSTVVYYTGQERERKEYNLNLTKNQGKFLYYLPFPTEDPKSIRSILERAGIEAPFEKEILDVIYFLNELGIIEIQQEKKK
jgi:predicted transcriptional regulator